MSRSWVSSYGGEPASTSARVRPACSSTLVLAAKSAPLGVPRTGSPSSVATPDERTQRLRYHSRLAVAQAHAVHHALAHEPVVALARVVQRVGPDAQVAAVEEVGQRAGHRQVGRGQLLGHGREVVPQVAVGGGAVGCW